MDMPKHDGRDHLTMMQAHLRSHVQRLTGLTDTRGIEVLSLIRVLAKTCEAMESRAAGEGGLSGPRYGLLMRLFAEEEHGNHAGITPTSLSHFQSVHKNTISALLRGLEEQGLIQRAVDAEDYRAFRIQLTPAGRELVRSTAPQRIQDMNRVTSGLSDAEHDQLIALLTRLLRSLWTESTPEPECDSGRQAMT